MASSDDASAQQDEPPPDDQRCRALTDDGGRCTRRAADGEFCYQHDEDDPTIDDEDGSSEATESSESAEPDDSEDSTSGESDDSTSAETNASSVMAVRGAVVEVAGDLIGRPLDGVVEVRQTEDGWIAVVEVIERRSVPDTQDILGQYELSFESPDDVTGYRRTGRYRRADTGSDEF